MVKIAVFYYTQTGQALQIAQSICAPFAQVDGNFDVIYKEIVPEKAFPFPWSRKEFFDIFPESRLGIFPFGIMPIDFSDVQDAELIILVGQTWYLSPSIPIQAFLQDEQCKSYLKGKSVVFVNGCRNMWLMTFRKIRQSLSEIGASLVGHIVLQDRAQNLVSVMTIVRWLMGGHKEATKWLPAAGVSDQDITASRRFGGIISKQLATKRLDQLQDKLMEAGAINYNACVLQLEQTGHRLFYFWAKFIRLKGEWGNPARQTRCTMLFYYLLFVLYVLSPIVSALFYLTWPLHRVGQRRRECYQMSIS